MHLVNSNPLSVPEGNSPMPQTFKHYEIRVCLDANPLSPVFQAWDTSLHRMVAIKQLANLGNEFETVLKRARIAAALTHSAFVKIHALEEHENGIYIVMELVKGVTLLEWMQDHQGRENQALIHIKQTAMALEEAQAAGLIHGDLQPSNFMVDTVGKIRILNLGFAAHYNPHAVKSVVEIDPQGSISYLAPERFSEHSASAASDVFALGTILYQLLVGATPFNSLRGLALVAAQAQTSSEQWPWPGSVSLASRDLILGMTKRELSQRFNWQQVQEECQKLVVKESSSNSLSNSKINDLQLQLNAESRRRHWRYAFVVAGLLAVAGVGVWQAKPNWAQIAKALKPYSESIELEQGMKALAMYDKPGMLDEATKRFNNVIERDASNARAVAGLSIVYIYRFRSSSRDDVWRERALASAQQGLSLNPNMAITQTAYALALDPHNQFDAAMTAVQKAKSLEPNNLLVWQTEMRIFLLARQYDAALRTAEASLKIFPDDWLISNLKGIVHFNQAQYSVAETIFRSMIERHPDVMLSYNNLAMVLGFQGRIDEALQVLQQGLQVRPDASLYARLGQIKFTQADYVSAANALEKAIVSNPQDYENWYFLADSLVQIPGKADQARAIYEKARELLNVRLEQRPNDGWVIVTMAIIQAHLGEYNQSRSMLRKALELAPGNPDVHFQAACVYELIGQRADALAEIEKAKQLGFSEAKIRTEPVLKDLLKDARYQ